MSARVRAELLRRRLVSLESVSRETEHTFDRLETELQQDIRKYKNTNATVDATADISRILLNLGNIVKSGVRATALQGQALEQANEGLQKESLTFLIETEEDILAKRWSSQIGANDGLLWALGKTTVQSWFELTSPSFWGVVYNTLRDGRSWQQVVTESPLASLEKALDRIKRQKKEALQHLQAKIVETKTEISTPPPGPQLVPARRVS
jgi:hypothetical protein